MLFNTIDFVVFFILVVTTLVVIKNRNYQYLFLLAASYFFFYYSANYLISLLIFSTILDFYVGKEIFRSTSIQRKKLLLILSLAGNIGLLGFFKYADFGIAQLNSLGIYFGLSEIPYLNLALPIGISFYTFQTISYTVDIYRGKLTPSNSIKEFALFVAFFPQLVSGPIIRASHFLPQLREKLSTMQTKTGIFQTLVHRSYLRAGITMMTFGFLKKMFFADNIAPLADVLSNSYGLESSIVVISTIAAGIQIYCDFSGYSDIAIGAALLLGFKIPINFNKPYFATSPSDFWQRWHISLSTWLRDYLYIPLGGKRKSPSRTYLNLFTVMVFGGLWHGASWNFVIWGILHGVYLAIHKAIANTFPSLKDNHFLKSRWGKIFSILVTQYFVFLAWIPFRVQNFENALFSMKKYVLFDFIINDFVLSFLYNYRLEIILMVLFIILNFISYKTNLLEKITKTNLRNWSVFFGAVVFLILFFYGGNAEEFIYFKF